MHIFFALCFILFLTALYNSRSAADSDIEKEIDEYMQPYLAMKEFNGNILIAKGDEIIYQKSFGMADYEKNIPLNPKTKFGIGSLTKTFTSAAIVVLYERGMLGLDDPVSKFVEDFPRGDEITIEMLLGHAGGLPSEHTFADYREKLHMNLSLEECVNRIAKYPLEFEPGTDSRYSNEGYVLLAYIIEKVSGLRYEKFLDKEIFTPLSLTGTGIIWDNDETKIKAAAYQPGPPPHLLMKASQVNVSHAVGSGALSSTAPDLLKWLVAVGSKKLFDIDKLDYPFGWGRRNYFGKNVIEQSGIYNGFSSTICFFRDVDLKIIYLSNVHSSLPFNKMKTDLAAIVLGEDYQIQQLLELKSSEKSLEEKFFGRYRLDESSEFDITKQNNGVFIEWVNFSVVQYLDFIGDNLFYNRMENAEFEFVDNAMKDSLYLIWRAGDADIVCPRVN